ncbi:hypothetical protein HY498_03170 [Candidatus Woesearchaeota archaeon]|nr:hypothetical protein [Candidatus Woesearchaeota archaeon]
MKIYTSKSEKGFLLKQSLENIKNFLPKLVSKSFVGSSPPEIFVGQYGYPQVFSGILAPVGHLENKNLTSPEEWFRNNLSIEQVLQLRSTLIYSRFKTEIKPLSNRLLEVLQETSMSKKPTDIEFFLKKTPKPKINLDNFANPLANPALLQKAKLQENPSVDTVVEKVISDTDLKATEGILKLYNSNKTNSEIIKLLSSGLLGIKPQRKLVPSKWSITAVDDSISKFLISKIKNYPWLNNYQLFHHEYLGNHYEIILLPKEWSFEVIEAESKNPYSPQNDALIFSDYESFYGRKTYANSVTGAYYANKLAIAEYLSKIKRQSSALVLREVKPEYYAPLGVGILREATRFAFTKQPEKFQTLKEALDKAQTRLTININKLIENSRLLKSLNQTKLTAF